MTDKENMIDDTPVTVDQTQFGSEEPLFEKANGSGAAVADPQANEKKAKRKKMLLIAGGVAAVVIVVLLALMMMPRKPMEKVITKPTPSPTPTTELGEQEKRVQELRSDLKSADPTKLDLPFPPVNMSIGLEDPSKRDN